MSNSFTLALAILAAAAQIYLFWRRLLGYLRFFQQEVYERARFLHWLRWKSLTDPAWMAAIAAVALGSILPRTASLLGILAWLGLGTAQPDPRTTGKIPLRLTSRALRTQIAAFALTIVFYGTLMRILPLGLAVNQFVAAAILLPILPLLLLGADLILMPYETRLQRRFKSEAARRVAEVRPFIIGITGSYGKSSTKAMVAHILQFKGPTLAAAGSVNTLMGVTRHIRENLAKGDEYMVVEMGAFRRGSIRRLCELTPPSAAIITAVGTMHLERFGSTEEIVRAKSELAQALPADGILVANADSPGALRIARQTRCRVLLYGESSAEELDTRLLSITFSARGTHFKIRHRGTDYDGFTPLLGRPIMLNMLGAYTLATALGMTPEIVLAALRALRPVSNRLEVVEDNGITWIRDAYNSNPIGFRAALEVTAGLPVERRILVTPGVIELGPQQYDANQALAAEAAAVCDYTLIVSETNRAAFEAGYRDSSRRGALIPVENRTAAFRWLREQLRPGDSVILENDLPDLYENSGGLFFKNGYRRGAAQKA